MKQKASVTFEEHETVVLRQGKSHRRLFCERCDEDVLFVTPEVLAAMTGSSEREIFRLIEGGRIFFVEGERTLGCPSCYGREVEGGGVSKSLGEGQ